MAEERLDVVVDSSAAKRGIDALAAAFKGMVGSVTAAESATTKLFDSMSSSMSKLESHIFSLRNIIASFAVVIGVFKQIGDEMTRFQAFISAMSVSTSGLKAAREEFAFLMQMADRFGISINALSHNYSQMAAAATNSGMSLMDLRNIFESFSVAARVMHLSTQDTRLMFYALTQMISKGVVSMEELRRQLGEKLPGAMNIAAKSLGVAMPVLEAAIRKGIVDSAKFMPFFADAVKQTFSPGLVNAMGAFDAEVNRLTNNLQKMIIVFFDLGVADAFTNIIKELNRIMSDKGIAETFAKALVDIADGVTKFLKTIDQQTVKTFTENFSAALKKMGEVITQDVLPFVKELASWIGVIAAGWLVMKGITTGAAVGGAMGGPKGAIIGAGVGGIGAGAAAWGIGNSIDNAMNPPSGIRTGQIRPDPNYPDPVVPPTPYKPKGTLQDVLLGDGGSNKKYDEAMAALYKKGETADANSVFISTQIDIEAKKYGELSEARKQDMLAMAAWVDEERGLADFHKGRKSDAELMAKASTQMTDEMEKKNRTQFAAIQQSFKTEEQLLDEKFETELKIITEGERLKTIPQIQANEQRYLLEERYLNESNELRKKKMTEAQKIMGMSYRAQSIMVMTEIQTMTQGVAGHSRKMFEINKYATLANIILKTPDAISSAYTFGARFGGHYAGLAMGALAAGVMATQFRMAKNARYEGGGGGSSGLGGGGGGISVPSVPAPAPSTGPEGSGVVINLTIEGNMVGNEDFVNGTLIPLLRDAINNRDVTIIDQSSRQALDLQPE